MRELIESAPEVRPPWLKVRPPTSKSYSNIKAMLKELNLATVCQEARCPNIDECWGGGTATFMLMGDTCTRACRFCAVKTSSTPPPLDPLEPFKVGHAIGKMDLSYVVITSVNRDELPDEGSGHFAKVVEVIKKERPEMIVEILTPDFSGRPELIETVVKAKPDVFAHNIETVEELTDLVRDKRAGYHQSLNVLKIVKEKDPNMYTKTSIQLGFGENDKEVLQTLKDLRSVECDVVTFGQYLKPTSERVHLPVEEYITPEKFSYWHDVAMDMGFLYCASGPLVRSSYRAGEFFLEGLIKAKRDGQRVSKVSPEIQERIDKILKQKDLQ